MNDLQRIKPIFSEALDKKGPDRESYLNEICGKDHDLKEKVEALLVAHEKAGDFLDSPVLDPGMTSDESPISEGPGTVIGRYKLLEKIGEGGMAVVYMAEQEKPIRRKVALKIIKLGMDTKSVIARFEAERQALAMMDHPNIAKVLDAGATETGRPYFVMELVTGVSITEYCDKNNLSTKDRLALFIQVCNAVQHAHQKGIIHRDIKPTNVMVEHHDGKPVPKVIDFGIAKATNQRLTEKTLFTRYAHIIGTPAYMSPEQAELSALGIDIRSDIYSLGVLLYELLTGTTPFSDEELRKAGYFEMQRIIREQEPVKPSTKLSTLGETLTDIAKRRGCTPDLLTKTIRGDLDWIVMKALEKNRAQRYEEVSNFALDIERHLELRPVSAHAPSASYRAQKFLRRNRSQAVTVLSVVVVLGTIIVLSIWNRYQVGLAEAEGARQMNALSEARRLVKEGDLTAARQILLPILESKYVGLEARNLFVSKIGSESEQDSRVKAIMDKHYHERVQYYTDLIQADPTDPNNYLRRAQQYKYLSEEDNVNEDMSRYTSILGQEWFSQFRFGKPRIFKPLTSALLRNQLIFSFKKLENGIYETSIAFGQKGRSIMKPFKIPMLLTSLFALCFFPDLDMSPVYADFQFGPPINTTTAYTAPCLSTDRLELYFELIGGLGEQEDSDIWLATRQTTEENWDDPVRLDWPINTPYLDGVPRLSFDGLTLYFASRRPGGYGNLDIWAMTRPSKGAPWSQPINIGPPVNTRADETFPGITADGLELYFSEFYNYRNGGCGKSDIWVAKRPTTNDPWGEPVNLGPPVNTANHDSAPTITPDGLVMFIMRDKSAGGYGGLDIWMTKRTTRNDEWGKPVNVGPFINTDDNEDLPYISPDGSSLFFLRTGTGTWQAPILPVVDFNGDSQVDGKEVLTMTEYWGLDNSLCDIGPTPMGDGIVDLQDVIALVEYLGKEVHDSTLLAHWALDETEGLIASDSAGENDAFLNGNPIWQTESGMIDGAIELDGVDDCILTESFMDPADQPFSVLAWVKGGEPGQVIISQSGACDWLCINSSDGSLMSKLCRASWNVSPLYSDAVITDGQWHRVGFVWDGITRALYVDEQEVARDGHSELWSAENGLVIGGGAMSLAGTYFSGLIDDVRIYNRVVSP